MGLAEAARNIATSAKKKVGQIKVKVRSRDTYIEDPPVAPPAGANDYLLGSDNKTEGASKPAKPPRFIRSRKTSEKHAWTQPKNKRLATTFLFVSVSVFAREHIISFVESSCSTAFIDPWNQK
jgi:hypothetical protein